MKKYTQKAFTLVELIVVITILAILATVAFISLGGQTDNARNTVKKDSIGKLATVVENARTTGVSIASFTTDATANDLTNATDRISGKLVTAAATAKEIGAWDINYAALDVKEEDFKDWSQAYKFGFSKFRGGKYEIAGSLKEWEFSNTYLVGNYEPRISLSIAGTIDTANHTLELTLASDVNKLFIWDTTNSGKVVRISDDKMTITFDATGTVVTPTTLADETLGLIESTVSTEPVLNNSTTNLPY